MHTDSIRNGHRQVIEDGADLASTLGFSGEKSIKSLIQEEMSTERAKQKGHIIRYDEALRSYTKTGKKKLKTFESPLDQRTDAHIANYKRLLNSRGTLSSQLNLAAMLEAMSSYSNHESFKCYKDQRRITAAKSKQSDEIDWQLVQISAKAFVDQMFIDRKYMNKGRANRDSKEIMDAFDVLNANTDSYLKFLQDPYSAFLKHIEDSEHAKAAKGLMTSSPSDEFPDYRSESREYQGHEGTKKIQKHLAHSAVWKKLQHQRQYSSRGNSAARHSGKVVLLKPMHKPIQQPEDVTCHCSSILPSDNSCKKEQNERLRSFSFREIKKKVKYAIGESWKGQKLISCNSTLHKLQSNKDNLKFSEKLTAEVISNAGDAKSRSKLAQHQDFQANAEPESHLVTETICKQVSFSKFSYSTRQEADVLVEGKRHLSRRFKNVNANEAPPPVKEPSRTLWRILASPEDDDLDALCPRKHKGSDSVPGDPSISPCRSFSKALEGRLKALEERKAIPFSSPGKTEVASSSTDLSRSNNDLDESESSYQSLNVSYITRQRCKTGKFHEEVGFRNYSLQISPPETPTSTENQDVVDCTKDRQEHASPISVLEPFLIEDEASPSSLKGEWSLQPRRIDFEEFIDVICSHPKKETSFKLKEKPNSLRNYLRSVLKASSLNKDQLLLEESLAQQPMIKSSLDGPELSDLGLHFSPRLLLDYVEEVVLEVDQYYFGCTFWPSLLQEKTKPASLEEEVLNRVTKEVDRQRRPEMALNTLEQLARFDLAKSGSSWLNNSLDLVEVVVHVAEHVLEESLLDTILQFHT